MWAQRNVNTGFKYQREDPTRLRLRSPEWSARREVDVKGETVDCIETGPALQRKNCKHAERRIHQLKTNK